MRIDLDHIGILGPDIDALVSEFRRLGFTIVGPAELTAIDPGGVQRGLGQFSAHIMFADSYIELTSVPRPAADHHLARFLAPPWGIRLLILRSRDADASYAHCRKTGLDPGPVQRAVRRIDYGSRGDARFRWFGLPGREWPEALVAFVEHETPGLVFQEQVALHANGARGLTGLYSRDHSTLKHFERVAEGNGIEFECLPAELHGHSNTRSSAPIAAIRLGVRHLSATAAFFDANDIDYRPGQLGLCVSLRCGVLLLFAEDAT